MEYSVDEETQKFIDKYATPKSPIPVDIQFDQDQTPFFNDDIKSTTQPINLKPSPSFGETVLDAFNSYSELHTASQHMSDASYKNPFHDEVPENYSPADDQSNFDGLDQKYHNFILKSASPLDAKNRYFMALQRQEEDTRYKDGSMLGQIIGGFGGAVVSPTTYIPIARAAKYASLAEGVLYNTARAVPSLAGASMAHNAYQNTKKMGGNIEDFVVDSVTDTIGGIAFMGAGFGLSHAFNGAKLFESNQVLKHIYAGVEIRPKLEKDGTVSGYKATPISGMDAGAAAVDAAQKFADSQFAQKGMFAIPYLGKWIGKGANIINPTVRMLNSRFKTVAGFIDRVADHGLVTLGVLEGNARPISFEERMAKLGGENKALFYQLQGLHLERNGIDSSNRATGLLKKTKAQWDKDGYVSEEKFNEEIIESLINDAPSLHAATNDAVSMLRPAMDEMYKPYREAYNLPPEILSPKTANAYLNRVWDTGALELHPEKWESMWVDHFTEMDQLINSHMQPIQNFKEQVKLADEAHKIYIQTANITDTEIKKSAENLKGMKKTLKQMQDKVHDELRTNEDLRSEIEDANALSAKESRKLKSITKALRQHTKAYKQQQAIVQKLNHQVFILESTLKESKTKNAVKKLTEELKPLKSELEQAKSELTKRKDARDLEEENLQEKAANNEIKPIFYNKIPDSQRVKFKNPNNKLKFRKTYESEFHMRAAANGYRDTILNQTAEDTITQIMGQLMGRSAENPTLQRTLMIGDKKAYAAGFLSKNVAVNVINYRNTLGRRTYIKQVFGDVTIDGGIEPVIARLTQEFNAEEKEILKIKDKVKQKKELAKLQKDYKQAKLDMRRSYEKMMGRTRGSDGLRKFSNITRSFAAATKLGAVPLTMIADMMGVAFKHGFWPTIRDGLLPALTTINGRLKGPEGAAYRDNACHAHLAFQHVNTGMADRNYGGIAQPYQPVAGKIESGMSKFAHISGNLYGTNYVENFLQRWTASVIQSKIMRYMHDFKNGTLKPRDREKLLVYGLQPEQWADRFIEGWKSRGKDGNGFGGYQSRYWEWADVEASNRMSQTINKGTRDTIIRRGMFDAPFMLDDPIMAMVFPFKGFLFASMTRYLIPLMQRPDAEKLMGTMLMLSAGAMVSPLRHISRGESPIQDDESMFMNALRDSNVFSFLTETLDDVNLLTGGNLLKGMQNDKYRNRTQAGSAGPIVGSAYDIAHILTMMGTGNYNQTDIRKMAGMTLPPTQAWYLRGLTNKMLESTGLPKTFSEADRS